MGKTRFRNIAGQKFFRLTAIEPAGQNKAQQYLWKCKCDCGKELVVIGSNLIRNNSKSCGCYNDEVTGARNRRHSMAKTRIWNIWTGITKRCTNPNCKAFKDYGGRGIFVCDEWKKFENFYEDMKDGYADHLTLERKDPNKGYNKDNCVWATYQDQARNKRDTVFIEFDGKRKSMAEWSDISGIPSGTIGRRIKSGWDTYRAVFYPTLQEIKRRKWQEQ